jgi:tetratricopeptide (TPR) repeat protein
MPRADIIASIFKETGSTGVADAVKSLGSLAECSTANEAAKILLGASVGGGLGLISLVGGSLIDAWQRKKDMKALQAEFRRLHWALQRVQEHQIDSKEWVGLLNEVLAQRNGVPESEAELQQLTRSLHEAMREELADQGADIDAWFQSIDSNLSALTTLMHRTYGELQSVGTRVEKLTVLISRNSEDEHHRNEAVALLAADLSFRSTNETIAPLPLVQAIRSYLEVDGSQWRLRIDMLRYNPALLLEHLRRTTCETESLFHRKSGNDDPTSHSFDQQPLRELAACYLITSNLEYSAEIMRRILDIDSNDIESIFLLLRVYMMQGRLSDGMDLVSIGSSIAKSTKQRAMCCYYHGVISLRYGRFASASKHFDDAMQFAVAAADDEMVARIYLGMAGVAEEQEHSERAVVLLEDSLAHLRSSSPLIRGEALRRLVLVRLSSPGPSSKEDLQALRGRALLLYKKQRSQTIHISSHCVMERLRL